MGFTKAIYDVDNITSLSDTPNATEGLTGAQLRSRFDKTGADGKTYVNTLVDELDISVALQNSGWVKDTTTTFSYTSATRIATSVNLTAYIGIGDKIKYVQGGITKHGYVIEITATYIDVTGGSDYTVANEPITEFYYSHSANPFGFPNSFNWTPVWTNVTNAKLTTDYARFKIIGTRVFFELKQLFNSTDGISNIPLLTLPITIISGLSADEQIIGNCDYLDVGTSWYLGNVLGNGSLVTSNTAATYSSRAYITSTVPFTWTTDDGWMINGNYNIA